MEIKLPEIQAIIDELKNDSQTMANEQVRKAVEQLDEMLNELNLKQTLVTPDALLAPQACLKQIERLVSTIPQLFESVSQKEILLGLLLQAATICRRMGETEHTLQYCEQILDFAGIQGYTHIRAEALRQLGHLQFYLQQWNQAQAYYKQCLALFEEEDDRGGIASIYNRLGNIASEQGEYELARKYHQQAIDMALPQVAQREGYQRLIAGAYNDLGVIASKQTDWSAAIDYFEKSLNICDQIAVPRLAALVYMNLAMAYVDCEEWEAAGESYAEATAIAEESGDLLLLSKIYINRAEFLLNIASIDAAHLYCDKALVMFQKGRNNNGIAEAYKLYGRIYRYQKNWDAAIEAFTQSLHLYQACQNPQGEAEGCYEFGLMYKNCQNPVQARHFLQSAHHLYEQLGATDAIKRVDAALATLDV